MKEVELEAWKNFAHNELLMWNESIFKESGEMEKKWILTLCGLQ